jgi:LacI family transcriptional regulator
VRLLDGILRIRLDNVPSKAYAVSTDSVTVYDRPGGIMTRPRRTSSERTDGAAAPARAATRVTIRDVARAAGVSTGTVSRALNGRAGVHPDTRRRVSAAVAELGFDPDQAARELSNRRPVRVGLSVAQGQRRLIPFFVLFHEHLLDALASSGFRVHDVPTGPDGLPTEEADVFVLLGAHPDDPRLAHLAGLGCPFVLIGHRRGVRSVAADDALGGRLAAEHLLRLGHRDLLHVTGDLHSQAFADRAGGFAQGLRAAGIEPPKPLVCDDLSALGAYRALRRRLESGRRPSAVFAATDEMAVGCRAAALDAGMAVPIDLSVVGFDDMPEIGAELTTVRQDIREVARVAVELLHEALRGEPVRTARLPVHLITRGSTAERR